MPMHSLGPPPKARKASPADLTFPLLSKNLSS